MGRRICDQLVHSSLIGWWWSNRVVSQGLTLSVLRLQEAWGYVYAPGYQELNMFHLVGGFHVCKTTQGMCINYCYLGTSERRLKAGEGDSRGWDGWMTSPTQWTWVWASFGSWWWTGKPDLLQSTGLQRVGHAERLNWTEFCLRATITEPMCCRYWNLCSLEPVLRNNRNYLNEKSVHQKYRVAFVCPN